MNLIKTILKKILKYQAQSWRKSALIEKQIKEAKENNYRKYYNYYKGEL